MNVSRLLGVLVLVSALLGCHRAAERCAKTREAAGNAWDAYVAALESTRKQAMATQAAAHEKLLGPVDKRLAPAAQKQADARYDRSSEAWLRAYRSSFDALCTNDAECAALRRQESEATRTIVDMVERLGPATAAAHAARGDAEQAKQSADAAIIHPEHPELKVAQQLSAEVYERCKDLPPPAPKQAAEH